jgi:hypothetical protein
VYAAPQGESVLVASMMADLIVAKKEIVLTAARVHGNKGL